MAGCGSACALSTLSRSPFDFAQGRLSTSLPRISCGSLVASANFMRLSLRKGAYAALSSAVWQAIRLRFGRDDNSLLTLEAGVGSRNG